MVVAAWEETALDIPTFITLRTHQVLTTQALDMGQVRAADSEDQEEYSGVQVVDSEDQVEDLVVNTEVETNKRAK